MMTWFTYFATHRMLATRIAELEHRLKVLEISGLWTSEDTDLSELLWSEGWREGGVSSSLVVFVTCSAALSTPSSILPQTKLPSHLKSLEHLTLNCMRRRADRRKRRRRRRRRKRGRRRGRRRGGEKRRSKTTLPQTHFPPPVEMRRGGSIIHLVLCRRTIQPWSTWHNGHHLTIHYIFTLWSTLSDQSLLYHVQRVYRARPP